MPISVIENSLEAISTWGFESLNILHSPPNLLNGDSAHQHPILITTNSMRSQIILVMQHGGSTLSK